MTQVCRGVRAAIHSQPHVLRCLKKALLCLIGPWGGPPWSRHCLSACLASRLPTGFTLVQRSHHPLRSSVGRRSNDAWSRCSALRCKGTFCTESASMTKCCQRQLVR